MTAAGELAAGYTSAEAARLAGISLRQADWWARTGVLEPSVRAATGSGSQRLYSAADVEALAVIRRLRDAGLTFDLIRVLARGRSHGEWELAPGITLHISPLEAT